MNCPQLKTKYEQLLNLQNEFQGVLATFQGMKQNTMAERDQTADILKKLQTKIQSLINNNLVQILDFKFNETQRSLKKQYASVKNILFDNDVIAYERPKTVFDNPYAVNDKGIKNPFPETVEWGIAEFFPIPTEEQIRAELMGEKKEFYDLKIKQGFTRLQVTPIVPLNELLKVLAKVTYKHKDDLFAAQKKQGDKKRKLTMNIDNPIYFSSADFGGSTDLQGNIIYYPKIFTYTDHQGLTKKELLIQSLKTPFPGYVVELKQENQLIPRQREAETVNERKSLESGGTAEYYLENIQEGKEYSGEDSTSIDSEMINAIISLDDGNGVIRSLYDENDIPCYTAGTYCKNQHRVPIMYWDSDDGQFVLDTRMVNDLDEENGVATSVRLGQKNKKNK